MSSNVTMREGKFKLNTFELTTPIDCRTLKLAPYCARADIYESVLEPTVIAEFIIVDKVGMFNRFNFLEQRINIDFTTYEDNKNANVKYTLYPIAVDPAETLPDDKGITYKITCVSREAIKSTQIKNIPLVRKKTESETIINALLQLVETDKNYFFEKTLGLQACNFTELTPFEAIDQIRLKSMSAQYSGHCFLFYENSKGYHFKTFEGLIDDGKKKIGDKYYTQVALADVSVTGSRWRNILGLKAIQTGNQNVTRLLGGGKVLIKRKNVITGQIDPYTIDSSKIEFVSLNKGSTSQNLTSQKELSKDEGRIEITYFDPSVETADQAEAKVLRPYYLSFLFNTVAHITVYGDTTVTIGDVITLDIPEHTGLTFGEERPYVESNEILAGNYLITKCRHILSFNEGAEYMQALEIVKDGYGGTPPRPTK
jgi:hypothetical protein